MILNVLTTTDREQYIEMRTSQTDFGFNFQANYEHQNITEVSLVLDYLR